MSVVAARVDGLLTAERLRVYPVVFLVLGAASLIGNVVLADLPRTLTGEFVLPDYAAHWTGGRMLLTGRLDELYDPAAQLALQRESLGESTRLSWFVSPPFVAVLYAPFARLPYLASAAVWTAFSAGLLVASLMLMRPMLPALGRRGRWVVVVIAVAATQPVLECIGSGQDSAMSLFIVVCAIRLLASHRAPSDRGSVPGGRGSVLGGRGSASGDRWPASGDHRSVLGGRSSERGDRWAEVGAGVMLSLGLFKPQLFMIAPIALWLLRRWYALAAWLLTAVGAALASVALVGVGGVRAWLSIPFSEPYRGQVQVGQAWKMLGIPALSTSLAPPALAEPAEVIGLGVCVLVVLRLVVAVRRRPRRPAAEVGVLAALTTVLVCPHLVVYDLLVVVPAALYLVERHNDRSTRLNLVLLFVITWTAPVRHALAGDLRWPATVVAGAAWGILPLAVLWTRLLRSPPNTVASSSAG